jgi:hypothetical protein
MEMMSLTIILVTIMILWIKWKFKFMRTKQTKAELEIFKQLGEYEGRIEIARRKRIAIRIKNCKKDWPKWKIVDKTTIGIHNSDPISHFDYENKTIIFLNAEDVKI